MHRPTCPDFFIRTGTWQRSLLWIACIQSEINILYFIYERLSCTCAHVLILCSSLDVAYIMSRFVWLGSQHSSPVLLIKHVDTAPMCEATCVLQHTQACADFVNTDNCFATKVYRFVCVFLFFENLKCFMKWKRVCDVAYIMSRFVWLWSQHSSPVLLIKHVDKTPMWSHVCSTTYTGM